MLARTRLHSRLPRCMSSQARCSYPPSTRHDRCFATAAAVAPAPSPDDMMASAAPIQRYHPTQPPSYKPPELRKSQLHRQYTNILRSSPLMLVFQHNNLLAPEWAGIRRELGAALRKVSASNNVAPLLPGQQDPADGVKLQIVQAGVFSAALRVVEFYTPEQLETEPTHPAQQQTHAPSHALSKEAYEAGLVKRRKGVQKRSTPLTRLFKGPMAVLSFPSVTPAHLAAALSILAPTAGSSSAFPAPKRKTSPGYYEMPVQNGLQKLMLLGARVEGKSMDSEGVKWVGGIAGGMDGLRAQVVNTLQAAGMGLSRALEGAGNALWATMESRRMDMDKENKDEEQKDEAS